MPDITGKCCYAMFGLAACIYLLPAKHVVVYPTRDTSSADGLYPTVTPSVSPCWYGGIQKSSGFNSVFELRLTCEVNIMFIK